MSAAEDPLRTRCVTELSSDHTVSLYQNGAGPFHQNPVQQFHCRDVQPVVQTIHKIQQRSHIHQSQSCHSHQHCKGLCPSTTPRRQSSTENTGLLCRAREFADHHGANGPPQERDLSRGTCRHLPQLSQNELGISCQNSCGELHPPSKLDKKRSWYPDTITLLRILRIFLRDCRH